MSRQSDDFAVGDHMPQGQLRYWSVLQVDQVFLSRLEKCREGPALHNLAADFGTNIRKCLPNVRFSDIYSCDADIKNNQLNLFAD